MTGRVTRLARFSLTVADPERAGAFYRDGLGFERRHETVLDDPALFRLLGLAPCSARSVVMALGNQEIELAAFDPPGRPYPAGSDAADIWFQHFAIVVRDMQLAFDRVRRQPGFSMISHGGPQHLPPGSGSVVAFKFRDPDGHPLELLEFPRGSGPAAWRDHQGRDALCLGVDHSAIDVADSGRSAAFYTGLLGMSVASRTVNSGPPQERLDGLDHDVVDVIGIEPSVMPTPHIELLGYRAPPPPPGRTAAAAANDVAATRLVLEVDAIDSLAAALRRAGVAFVSPGVVELRDGGRAALIRDPDGHALMLVENPKGGRA